MMLRREGIMLPISLPTMADRRPGCVSCYCETVVHGAQGDVIRPGVLAEEEEAYRRNAKFTSLNGSRPQGYFNGVRD